jgi:hypothetical protein
LSDEATVTVLEQTLTASITPSGPTTFCEGGSVTLTASSGSSWLWSNGATTQAINVSATGSYTVTVTNAAGCSATSAATVVTVNPLPTAAISASGPTTFCAGGSVTLTASTGSSWLWSTGATTQAINVSATGSYTVTVTNAAGCSATSAATVVTVNPLPTATITGNNSPVVYGGSAIFNLSGTPLANVTYKINSGENQILALNGSGTATVTVINATTNQTLTLVSVSNTTCSQSLSATSTVIVNPPQGNRPTSLTYSGTRSVQYGSTATLSAILWDNQYWRAVSGKTITFTIGTQTTTAVTNSLGIATTTILISQAPGSYRVLSNFAGDATYAASNDNDAFTITRRTLTAGLTGTVSKVYDNNAIAYLLPLNYTLTGVINGDNVLLNNPATGIYNNKNVGTNKAVTVTGLALMGTKAAYYTLASTSVRKNIGVITAPLIASKSGEVTTDVEPEIAYVDLKVYPNPFSEKLRFEFVSPVSVNARVDLYDMTGRLVKNIFEQPIEGGVSYEAEFRPETIISGMYIYRVTLGEAIYNGKVVFKKE